MGSSNTFNSFDPILSPIFPFHHAPPAHAISFPNTLSASDGCPKISCVNNETKSGFITTVAFSPFAGFASINCDALNEISFAFEFILFVICSNPPLPPSVVLTDCVTPDS